MIKNVDDERLYRLIAKNLAGEATKEENQELSSHISNNPDEQFFYDLLESYWNTNLLLEARFNSLPVEHFDQILKKAKFEQLPKVRRINTAVFKYCAAAAILIICSFGFWKVFSNKNHSAAKQQEIVVKKGSRNKTVLPDGSIVWINADTKLTYDKKFTGPVRYVILEGEAYFDVKKDPNRPFIVHTNTLDIKVLGTAFNVKAYQNDDNFEATLIHGSIEITEPDNSSKAKVILKPNEKFIFTKPSPEWNKTNHNSKINSDAAAPPLPTQFTIEKIPSNPIEFSIPETGWVQNTLIVENEKLEELAARLERWYDVKVTIKSEAVAQKRVRAVFKDETIENVMEALQAILKIKYKINGRQIVVE